MNQTLRRRRLVTWSLVGLLLLAFALRTHTLGERELSFDEVGSVFIASRGPVGVLAYVRDAIREHPPLYYVLLSLWMPLGGNSEFAVRFLSVGVGLATVAAMYRLARRAARRSAALLITFLLVLSPFHVGVSQNARMYALLALWSLLSILVFIRLLGEDRACLWVVFWLVTAMGMFTHYFMAFVLIAEDLFLLINWRRYRHLWGRWLAVHGMLGGMVALWVFLSPGLGATLISLWARGVASEVRWQALARAINGLYLGATLRPNWYHLSPPLILTALGIVTAQWQDDWFAWREKRGGLLLGLLTGIPLVAVLVIPERVTGRYLTVALPSSVLAMGLAVAQLVEPSGSQALEWLGRRLAKGSSRQWWSIFGRWALAVVGCSLVVGLVFVDVRAYRSVYFPGGASFRAKMDYLRVHARPDDGLLLHGPWQKLLLTYYDAGPLKSYTVALHDLQVEAESAREALAKIFQRHDRVWVSYASVAPVDPNWIVARWLHEHAHQVLSTRNLVLYYSAPAEGWPAELADDSAEAGGAETPAGSFRVFVPTVTRSRAEEYETVKQVDARFGERLRLEGIALANRELTSEEAILLLTKWRAVQQIPHGLTQRLELVGPAGEVWGDYEFRVGPAHAPVPGWGAGETFVERRGLVVPVGTPPGDYALRMRVFSAEGVEWLPGEGETFEVGPVRVRRSVPAAKVIGDLPGRGLRARFGDRLALVGHRLGGLRFTQGNPLLFDLYWQALISPSEEYSLGIELMDEAGSTLVQQRVQPVAQWFPTDRWQAGDVLLGRYAVPLPPDAAPGRYRVRLSVYAADGSPLPVSGTRSYEILDWWERTQGLSGTGFTLFKAHVEARPRRYRPPAIGHRLDVVLGDDVRLLGYDLASSSVEPGGSVELTFYWKALRRMERVYAVFNHLVSPDDTLLAQEDSWPQNGAYPTTQWLPGEVVEDHYNIAVPADASPGKYELRVGMYDAGTNERPVTLVNGTPVPERYVALTTITVGR